MEQRFLVAMAFLLGAIFVARFIAESGLKALSAEQKGRLLEALVPFRKYGIVLVIALAGFGYWLGNAVWLGRGVFTYVILTQGWTWWHARKLELPAAYLRPMLVAGTITIAGVGACLGFVFGLI